MNLANLKRTLKFDYLAFLAITRSFFTNKNFLKYFGFIFGLYFIGIFKFLTSDVLYRDDTGRFLEMYNNYGSAGSRFLSSFLGRIFHMNSLYLNYISSLTQLIAIAFLSIASMTLVKIVNKKITYFGLIASLAVGLSPFFLECLSYKFDSPYMALATTCAILPFLFVKRLSLFFITSVLFLLCMWNTYQTNNGIYIVLSMFVVLNLILQKANLKEILKFIFVSILAFIVALAIYKFLIIPLSEPHGYTQAVTKTISSFDELKQTFTKFYQLMDFYIGEHIIRNLFFVFCILFTLTKLFGRKANLVVSIFSIVIFLFVGFFATFGIFYVFSNLNWAPRLYASFGTFVAIITISLTAVKIKVLNFAFKSLVLFFSYSLIVISFIYMGAMITQKEYNEFRISQAFSFFQSNSEYKDYTTQISGHLGITKPIINSIDYIPIISHMILAFEHADWFINLHKMHNLQYRKCSKNQILLKKIETKFNTYEIYKNKCINVVYENNHSPFVYKNRAVSNRILKQSKLISNFKLNENLKLSVYGYDLVKKLKISTLIFEFDKEIPKIASGGDTTLAIHLHQKGKSGFINANQKIENFKKIGGKYYYSVGLANVDINSIERIEISFWNRNAKKNSAKFSINLKEPK